MLASSGKVPIAGPLRAFLLAIEDHCTVFPVTPSIAERSVQFSTRYPKDPADRIIGATALTNGLELVTIDRAIRASGEVPCIW